MSNAPGIDPETRKVYEDFQRMLRQKTKQERETLLRQVRDEAVAEELAEARQESERAAETLRAELTRDPAKEALAAREQAKSAALLLIMLLLILLLIAAATGRSDILRFTDAPGAQPTLQPRLGEAGAGVANASQAGVASASGASQPSYPISPLFQAYYNERGGERIFGRPISAEMVVNGRRIQWFERARLEDWPEHAGTPYAIQGGLLGNEFTQGLKFPEQTYFVSRPSTRYFRESGHGVSDRFLDFWNAVDGMRTLGYPTSDQIQEMLPDKQVYTVQYFERGRIEYHPQLAGTPFELQLGLLGRAIYLKESAPNIIQPVKPTTVPQP